MGGGGEKLRMCEPLVPFFTNRGGEKRERDGGREKKRAHPAFPNSRVGGKKKGRKKKRKDKMKKLSVDVKARSVHLPSLLSLHRMGGGGGEGKSSAAISYLHTSQKKGGGRGEGEKMFQ